MDLNTISQPQRRKSIETTQNTLTQMILSPSDRFGHYARSSRIRHSAAAVAGHDLIQHHFHAFLAVLAAQRSFDLEYLVLLVN
jgi:hypothetical protein